MIKAKVICNSIAPSGTRLLSFEVEAPRITHAEFLTHRMLSRNAASSRAIPFDKMLEQLNGIPSRFGAANKGMQDTGEEYEATIQRDVWNSVFEEVDTVEYKSTEAWELAKNSAILWSKAFKNAGYHKQIYNRLTEPFQMIKVVVSATEWDNFFWLRDDEMADPTIAELARKMKEAMDISAPKFLNPGEWHLPYVCDVEKQIFTAEEAIKVSCARCAAVSFRNTDYTLAKCLEVYDRLVGSDKKHSSALEHCATPMNPAKVAWDIDDNEYEDVLNCYNDPETWQEGISHSDRDGNLWSGNFKGWIQYRKLIKGENYVVGQ